ncbi:NADP-dependent succinate-semialdehyde dehydrogenase [Herbaspirillum rubrisubalbicans M1]|uniref:NAD-dependent succinate-semialdehyde dehydrogenase n=1 Tax=Herbaspirillum rubrisubalbicans TaxID=80842 RepID=UPI00073A047D|nr:NAD-dependent succinate-semialdehyde dehydrogenase [Herbaspirillum rubrisubalbicans]ALU91541.1 NADP-dependent succinate-semialdehyde dehydrogenase [Herbaspirillum rubrisubalbicans M1]
MQHPEIKTAQTGLYIGGQWREASDGARFDVLDPATEELLTEVASGSIADALDAVGAAYQAGPAWAATSPRQRSDILRKAFDLLIERKEAFARLIVLESGKALAEARGEVAYAAEFLRWYSEEAVRIQGEVSVAPGGANRILVVRQPIGVAVFVTPWNFPAAMATRKIGPALAAGCTVVLKPASETPLTALAMAEVFEEAGVPAGVINVVPSRKSGEIVKAMLEDPRVRKLSFTGSTEIGRVLLGQAAQNVVKCSMELGGNAPFIVLADADLEVAVASAMVAKLRNGGESCTAANRFYVERPVAEEFSRRFAQAMAAVKIGSGLEEGIQLGPLVNSSTLQKVHQLVTEAVEQGAKVLTGGKIREGKGYFYEPTLLTDVRADATILHREIFGPVAPICIFDSIDEVIRLANDTEFGLVSFVHSKDLGKALQVAERIEAGMVGINRGVVSDPAAPFGGWKQSGVGREGGHDGLLEYLESKYICASW